jgi:Sec-independent protein translocase protein TatA
MCPSVSLWSLPFVVVVVVIVVGCSKIATITEGKECGINKIM